MILIAVDPGKLCGYFRLNLVASYHAEYDPFQCVYSVQQIINHAVNDEVHVVAERFTFTSTKMTRQYDALEVIGALRYVSHRPGVKFTLQSRADKERVSNATLRQIGWYTSTKDGHANDAARHALVYLTRNFPEHPVVRQALAKI